VTPAERASTRAEYFAELDDALQDLPLLQHRIAGCGHYFASLASDIDNGRDLGDIADRLRQITDELVEAVTEYREIRSRCSGLLQALGRYGTGSVLGNAALLDDHPRF